MQKRRGGLVLFIFCHMLFSFAEVRQRKERWRKSVPDRGNSMGKTQVSRDAMAGSGNCVSETAGTGRASRGVGWLRGNAGDTGWGQIRKGLARRVRDLGIYPKPMEAMELETDMTLLRCRRRTAAGIEHVPRCRPTAPRLAPPPLPVGRQWNSSPSTAIIQGFL